MKRWQQIILAMAIILAIVVAAGYRAGTRLLQGRILEALGPTSHLRELRVTWFSVELLGVSIDGPRDWPAARTLEAERVTVVPDLRSLMTDQIRISSIVIEKPYLSMLRTVGK
ncbi:MAG: DUF748 domain-containing protein, partial [Candidatus Binatia bacterium]